MTTCRPASVALRRPLVLLLSAALLLPQCAVPASAGQLQQPPQRRTLLQWLFGGSPRQQEDIITLPTRKKRPRVKKHNAGSITTLSTQVPLAKAVDARHVLVVGDFLAAGLADGLEAAFAGDATTVVDSRTSTASGLTRDDYFNWPGTLGKYLAETHPAAVVVLLGANDRQQIRGKGSSIKFDSPAWTEAYRARVDALIKVADEAHAPLIWVGLPSFRIDATNAAALQFNAVYRNETAKAGAEFVDIWDGFVDENGKFMLTGFDVNGQPVRLRTSDGVGMTEAGKRKMAFYAEKPVRKILGDPLTVEKIVRLDQQGLLGPTVPEVTPKTAGVAVRIAPISLTDPELDGGATLLGDPGEKTTISGTLLPGRSGPAPVGRVDDDRLPALQ